MLDAQRPFSFAPCEPEAPSAVTPPEGGLEQDWRPVPGAYDWYGPVDPDGVMDRCDPFPAPSAPAKRGQPEVSP